MGGPLTVALTATATPQVQDDIVRRLDLSPVKRIITGFNRAKLTFEVIRTADARGYWPCKSLSQPLSAVFLA